MLKEQARLFNKVAMALDAATILCAFWLAYYLRAQQGGLHEINYYSWILLVFFPVSSYLSTRYGLYASLRTRSLAEIAVSLLKIHICGGLSAAAVIYLVEPHGLSRGLFFLFLFISYGLLAVEKVAVKLVLGNVRRRGYNFRNVLIGGTGEKSENFARYVLSHAQWGLRIAGFLLGPGEPPNESLLGYPVLAPIEDLVLVCKDHPIDEVVFCLTKENMLDIEDYLADLEELGITVRMALDLYDLRRSKREVTLFHGEIPIMTYYRRSFDLDSLFIKRCLDIVGAVIGLVLTGLLFPFIAMAIKLDSTGPVFFGQERVGEKGRTFTCWKFRSMYADAEQRKQELMDLNEMDGAMFKIKDDPRITAVGRFLRKTSLDELPQFWNVLSGEMSLVGTRPPTPGEVAGYENWHRRRICIKPGVTGLWQVSGRNQISDFDEIVRLDLEYIDNWSLLFDLSILLRTVKVVFLREGSH